MKKKVLVIALAVAMLALPMISNAQAKPGGTQTEIFHDVMMWGVIFPDGPADIVVKGNIQYGRYTGQSYGTIDNGATWFPAIVISWDGVLMVDAQLVMGTATFDVDYKINTKTMKGVVHLATVMTLPGGTFEGDIFLIGELLLLPDDTVSVTALIGENSMWHGFFKGTGAYEGWTIVQNINSNPPWFEYIPPGTMIVAGDSHLIKPIDE